LYPEDFSFVGQPGVNSFRWSDLLVLIVFKVAVGIVAMPPLRKFIITEIIA